MKICSLLPSGTEILFALGLGDRIIGVSDLCDFPDEALEKRIVCRSKIDAAALSSEEVEAEMRRLLEAGEELYELDRDWLEENKPDVVLTQDLCYFCEVNSGQVIEAVSPMPGQPRVVVLKPRTVADILETVKQVGVACCAESEAWKLVKALESRMETVSSALATVSAKPRVLSLEGVNPLVVGGHWIPDLLRLAGGELGAFSPGCPAQRITWSQVLDSQPEILFVDLCSSDLERSLREVPWLAAQEGWSNLPAVLNGQVYLIDHVYFSRPGPRVVQGLEILAQLTHPDRVSGCIPQGVVAKLDPVLAADCRPEDISSCFRPYP